jgi:hypothetical protein
VLSIDRQNKEIEVNDLSNVVCYREHYDDLEQAELYYAPKYGAARDPVNME